MRRKLVVDQVVIDVGRRVAELRQARGLTQEELAERARCSLKYLQRVEAGRNMRIDTLVRFANLFRVGIAELFASPASRRPRRPGRPARR